MENSTASHYIKAMPNAISIPGTGPRAMEGIYVVRAAVVADSTQTSCLIATSAQEKAVATVLLIHGAGMNASSWMRQLKGLAPSLKVVAIDLPGHGESDPIADPSVDRYAETAAALLDAKSMGPVFVAGHSLGGAVALALAAKRPELVRGLMLISSCARLPSNRRTIKALFRWLPMPVRRMVFFTTARTLLFGFGVSHDVVSAVLEEFRKCPPQAIRADVAAAEAMDLESAARAIRMPTLILCGAQDVVTPPALSQRLHELMPGSRLFFVPGAGHMLPLEAPDLVNRAMLQFVRSAVENTIVASVHELLTPKRDVVRGLIARVRGFWARRSRRPTAP